jgi:hypothetical protein
MSKTQRNRIKWARIKAAQERDSAGIAAGKLQLPPNESRSTAKAGKHAVRHARNQRYEYGTGRIYSTAQGCWVNAPTWFIKP